MITLPQFTATRIPQLREELQVKRGLGMTPQEEERMITGVIEEAVMKAFDAVKIPAPTAQDRKESEAWCGIIETVRDNFNNNAERFIKGI